MSEQEFMMSIHRAIKQGNLPEVIDLMAEEYALLRMRTPFGTWLQDAATYGKLDIVRWLLAQGLDINAYDDSNESPPLTLAASEGHVEVVRLLIEAGAKLEVSNSVRNPLFAAITGDLTTTQTNVAKLLIDAGIDVSLRYPGLDNMDALDYAKEWGRSEIVDLLKSPSKR